MMRGNLMRGMWAATALLALALSGCSPSRGSGLPHALVTVTPTATIRPTANLAWKKVTLPPGFGQTNSIASISPQNGNIAWVCLSGGANSWVIWKTTDAGVTWSQSGHFSYTAPMSNASCGLTADQTGTSALMAMITWGSGEAGTLRTASLYSADGATHWTSLSGYIQTMEFATVPGGAIAIIGDTGGGQVGFSQGFVFSDDGFQSWRSISTHSLPAQFFHFDIAPGAATLIGSGYNNTLWRSSDLGAHWTQIPTPDQQTGLNAWMPQRGAFLLCGNNVLPQTQINCSTDLGAHWTPITVPSYSLPCFSKCGAGVSSQTNPCPPVGVTADGALIDNCSTGNATPGASTTNVYRLAPGTTTWQNLGETAGPVIAVPATGPIWSSTASADQFLGYYTAQLPA